MMPPLIQQETIMVVGVLTDDGGAIYWYDVPPGQYENLRVAGDGRLMIEAERGYYSTEYYNYQTDGSPAKYEGAPYGNFRGYGNTSGYNTIGGYISRPGYQRGYGRRF
jgi:hypothetical protein